MEMCTDEEVVEGCEELLKKFLGHIYSVPKIEAVARYKNQIYLKLVYSNKK